jgi:hypothetical protein
MFGSKKGNNDVFLVSSNRLGSILRLTILSENCGRMRTSPRRNEVCSSFSLALKVSRSRKRRVETRIELKYELDWNEVAVSRFDGYRVMSCARTSVFLVMFELDHNQSGSRCRVTHLAARLRVSSSLQSTN